MLHFLGSAFISGRLGGTRFYKHVLRAPLVVHVEQGNGRQKSVP